MEGEEEDEFMDKEKVLREQFEWVRILGEGSFGKVYLIRDKETKTQYALKQYSRHQLEKLGKYKSLVRSVYILQHLNHPNIIRLVNYIVPDDYDMPVYTIFQCCKKGSLDNIKTPLRSHKAKSLIKLILLELAAALSYLKSISVAHRDIKPSNVTFSSEGVLKLIDFDEAVCFDDKFAKSVLNNVVEAFGYKQNQPQMLLRSKKSRASNFVGTQFYMSPQMILSTVGDEKGDVWAFACILYELIVGDYLHIEFDTKELFETQMTTRLRSFARACPDGDALELFKAIAKYNPNQRIDIDQAIKYAYFDEVRQQKKREEGRSRLVRFLRGNYGISKDKSYSTFGLDELNMSRGSETYRELNTAILVQFGKRWQYFEVLSGPIYFKFKHCKNDREMDFYIRYDRIDRIVKKQQYLQLYCYSGGTDEVIEVRTFKHLYPAMLTNLHQIMEVIVSD